MASGVNCAIAVASAIRMAINADKKNNVERISITMRQPSKRFGELTGSVIPPNAAAKARM